MKFALLLILAMGICARPLEASETFEATTLVGFNYSSFYHHHDLVRVQLDRGVRFEVPQIPADQFELLGIRLEGSATIGVEAWEVFPQWAWYCGVSVGLFDNEVTAPYYTETQGDIMDGTCGGGCFVSASVNQVVPANRLASYVGSGTKYVDFRMNGNAYVDARAAVQSGTFYLASYTPLKVTYTLRRIDPEAALPPATTGNVLGVVEWALRSFLDDLGGASWVPANVAQRSGLSLPAAAAKPKATWSFPSPKRIVADIHGFTGNTYTLMRGASRASGVAVAAQSGNGSVLHFDYDDTASGSSVAFFWIEETVASP